MTSQTDFRLGLLDPSRPPPNGVQDPAQGAAGKRYDVYRNNVTHSLIAALQTAFPLVRKIIGGQSFDTLAPQYVRAHPPKSPVMMQYGVDFPSFLQGLPQLEKLGYLPDCARLDLHMRRSYHAADAAPFDLDAFQTLPPDRMMTQKMPLAPSTFVLRSRWPLFDIWRFNMLPGAPQPRPVAQDVLITRPQFDPAPHLLPKGAADWLDHLAQGANLGDAFEAASTLTPDFDLAAGLSVAFSGHAFCMNRET